MKKISLLFATLLVLVSSIVFCACGKDYKDLKIECDVEEIVLVVDDDELCRKEIMFELSGAKSWGEINIETKPSGLVNVRHIIDDTKCAVLVEALQPTGDGANLIITHLGSGKSKSVPLKIGRKLQTAESLGLDFIIEAPNFVDEENNKEFIDVEIPTKELLDCYPENYTDTIVWGKAEAGVLNGIDVISFDKDGNKTNAINGVENNKGTSTAVKTVIRISEGYTTEGLIIRPISILKNEAILHADVKINVRIVELLSAKVIGLKSETHGDADGMLKKLALISNPSNNTNEPSYKRGDSNEGDYNFFSTALIDLTKIEKGSGEGETDIYNPLNSDLYIFNELYDVEISSNIGGLTLETIDFGKFRAIATSTCNGNGKISIRFNPKKCVGYIKSFVVEIDCTVGERPTSFIATNNGKNIQINKISDTVFESTTALNDSNTLGQTFKFDVLSTHTLDAVRGYKIKVNRNLLYYNGKVKAAEEGLDDIGYAYQIAVSINGRELTTSNLATYWVEDGNYKISKDILTSKNTIYIKWVKVAGGTAIDATSFGIELESVYDNSYSNIVKSGFDKLGLKYSLLFDRQRTVESISYVPVKLIDKGAWAIDATDAEPNWQFYFKEEDFSSATEFYGVRIDTVLGLNGTELTKNEIEALVLDFEIIDLSGDSDFGLGVAQFNINNKEPIGYSYLSSTDFKFDQVLLSEVKDIVLFGIQKDGAGEYRTLNPGDYKLSIKQTNKEISSRDITVYKQLTNEDIEVKVPTADFGGEKLKYEAVIDKPADWNTNYGNYYEYIGGEYVQVSNSTFNPNKYYYRQVPIAVYMNVELTGQPTDWGASYYRYIDGNYVQVNDGDIFKMGEMYYKQVQITTDTNDVFILSTSKQYFTEVEIKNKNFVGLKNQAVTAEVVGTLNHSYASSLPGKDEYGNDVIKTSSIGFYNISANQKNYVKLTYIINVNSYDYYKINSTPTSCYKSIYIYVYEPINTATFNHTMLYKYDYDAIDNVENKEEYGREILNININNNSETAFNYIDVKWWCTEDGSKFVDGEVNESNAKLQFICNQNVNVVPGKIIATLTQFGVQYPIYCDYEVRRPIQSDTVELETAVNTFVGGGGYVNLKVGETKQINATNKSLQKDSKGNRLDVSFSGVEYFVCSTSGYSIEGVVGVDSSGKLTALNSGRAKLIIVPKDRIKGTTIVNYFNTASYLTNKDAYLMIDVIVSDGSEENPFLISSGDDFRAIANDYNGATNDYHYALVNNIDLSGQPFTLDNFEGTISSFQENPSAENPQIFTIYGVMLTEDNPNLFKVLKKRDDGLAVLENVAFSIDINYNSTKTIDDDVYVGLIGTNNALIKNVEITVSGTINANHRNNSYKIGSLAAINTSDGKIELTNKQVVAVQGNIVVNGGINAIVVLGGVVGENEGIIVGADVTSSIIGDDGEVTYEVYYEKQGATADIDLRVKAVDDTSLDSSAIGGIVGLNSAGIVENVYVAGKIFGTDDANNLKVNNIGGIIGKNVSNTALAVDVTTTTINSVDALDTASFMHSAFTITNSFSNVQVKGYNNIGGAVGYDIKGSYQKVYYEIYSTDQWVIGNENVGGLIGRADNSSLNYCYVNSFAWNYKTTASVYEIEGKNNVGGLIGRATSNRTTSFDQTGKETVAIISSLASVVVKGDTNVAGLIGRLDNYGAIYTAYFYGVISSSSTYQPLARIYGLDNIPYNNVYAIVNGEYKIGIKENADGEIINNSDRFYHGTIAEDTVKNGFNLKIEHNNGKPYIIYEGKNLVSVIPTVVQINRAFTSFDNTKMYRINEKGDYVKIGGNYVVYNEQNHSGYTRYSLMAEVVPTGDLSTSLSDYRNHILVLYYYQFNNIADENALSDYYYLNTINMKDIIADDGIIVLPNTFKRFNLRSSDNGVASVLNGGRLLLNGEGQVTITLISTLNPSATASFVVVVRSKVLEFNLYSSANIRKEYKLNSDKPISIVKGSSKIIYADYTSTVKAQYGRPYEYKSATNMKIKFEIVYVKTVGGETTRYDFDDTLPGTTKKIKDFIEFNGIYNVGDGIYEISYGMPITISVNDYIDGVFEITAKPYVVANYKNSSNVEEKIEIELSSYFNFQFDVETKKGASAVNVNRTQIDMMPAEDASNIGVKISTDTQINDLYVEIEALGDFWEIANPDKENIANPKLYFVDMLDIVYGTETSTGFTRVSDKDWLKTGKFNISSISPVNGIQSINNISVKLNESSYYINQAFRLQVTFYVLSPSGSRIYSTMYINVYPQTITSVVALNYRVTEGAQEIKLQNTYQSPMIRPGSSNIITIDIAPNIAVYDNVEVRDITEQDKILFQQVKPKSDGTFEYMSNMDSWVDDGIKLEKYEYNSSKLYLFARLPLLATANITHTIEIIARDNKGNALYTTYLNVEAILYPTVVMTYTYPNGQSKTADTRDGKNQISSAIADLAKGVEAPIKVEAYNIDEGTLNYEIKIMNGLTDVTNNFEGVVTLENMYDSYILRFNQSKMSEWDDLVGKTIQVIFTASKSLNGITETCKATIEFTIRYIVIHGVSMTHTTSNDVLFGDWDETFETEFYFDKTDISYYNSGYWNVQYKYTEATGLNAEMEAINDILYKLNNMTDCTLYFEQKDGKVATNNLFMYSGKIQEALGIINNTEYGISIVNSNNKYLIKANKDNNKKFDINNMKLVIKFKVGFGVNNYPLLSSTGNHDLNNEFGFNIAPKTSPFEEYEVINSQQEFEDMIDGRYYQLTHDLTFVNYSPINTPIGGFNGNGYTITITSFNQPQLVTNYLAGEMFVGLFGTLAEDSVIQNLKVKYEGVYIDLNSNESLEEQHTNNIYFGGIAGINLGVITNVYVTGNFALKSQYITADYIDMGGITAVNGSASSAKVATITGSKVDIKLDSMALIGGVSGTNYGKIVNTTFNGEIRSKDTNQYVAEVATAGFVVENISGAYISLSYVDGGNIHSVGRTAGFVLNNTGTINNCYIQHDSISSQGNIGGFVYQSPGKISNCYANVSLGSSLFYNEFIYNTSNVGEVNNCYVLTDNDENIYVKGLNTIKTNAIGDQTQYKGFVFAIYGVWTISGNGPQLINSGYTDLKSYADIYNIYDVQTYEGFLNNVNNVIENKTYKLVRDIDFEAEGHTQNPITVNKTLKSNFEGNDMAIKNYNIYKAENIDSVGLFAKIEHNGIGFIRNLILQPLSVKASSSVAVGALAGIIDGSRVYNITIDNQELLMLGKNVVGGLAGIVKGDFSMGEISSNISTFATYHYNIGEQYNLYKGKNITGNRYLDNIDKVSYSGSVAGIVDGYNNASSSYVQRDVDDYFIIDKININGNLVLIAETVGGAFGLVGERTLVRNVSYNLPKETLYEGVYVSGGLVGENRGIIQSSSIYAITYQDGIQTRTDTKACFNNFAKVNGAIAGINIGGLINNCTSDIDVYTTKRSATAGGIVGRNIEGLVYDCEVSSTLNALFMGGIAGSDYSYTTIIKQQTGNGTATFDTLDVYRIIQNPVTYNKNCFVTTNDAGSIEGEMFINNKLTSSFVEQYVIASAKHFTINSLYMENINNNLVNARTLYGAIIGFADTSYEVKGEPQIVNNKIVCSIKKVSAVATEEPIPEEIDNIQYNGNIQQISPIAVLTMSNLNYTITQISYAKTKNGEIEGNAVLAHLVYLVACDSTGYESWSSTQGYGSQYILITQKNIAE